MLNGTNRIAGGVRAGGSIVVNSRLDLRLPDLTPEPARPGGAARAGVRVVSRR